MTQANIPSRPGGQDGAEDVPNLRGVSGRLGLKIGSIPSAILEVNDGIVRLREASGPAATDAVVICEEPEDASMIVKGKLNPVVATLQGRIQIEGDLGFAAQVLLALNAGSPFRGQRIDQRSTKTKKES
jgi:putative sterol carrier protein